MLGFAQPTTYVVIIMKNFLTALASALLVAVIVTSLHYFVFSNDMDRAPLALFVLSFLGMAAVALFNVRLSALRSGLAAPGLGHTQAAPASQPKRESRSSAQSGKANAGKNNGRQGAGGRGKRGDREKDKKDGRGADSNAKPRSSNKDGAASAAPKEPAVIPDGPRETGTVKWFNRSKGFGFIVRPNGEEIFVHHRSIRNSDETRRSNLRDGQEVNYVVADHSKGQQAEDVVGE